MDRRYAYSKSLWADLQNQDILPYGGNLMSNHEKELQNLVQHIEIRVKARENVLKEQLKKIYKHLDLKIEECQQQKTVIENCSNKILSLREKINYIIERKQKYDINYDEQLEKFMSQSNKLKEVYEHLYAKYLSKMNEMLKQHKEQENQLILQHSEVKEHLVKKIQKLKTNFRMVKTKQKEDEKEIGKLLDLVRIQDKELINADKSDDLLKGAIIALRTNLEEKIDYISNLEGELTRMKKNEENRKKIDSSQIQSLLAEKAQLEKDVAQYKENCKDYFYLQEEIKKLKVNTFLEILTFGMAMLIYETLFTGNRNKLQHA